MRRRLNGYNLKVHLVADARDFINILHGLVGDVGNVREAVNFRVKLHEQPKRIHLDNATAHRLSGLIPVFHNLPRVVNKALQGQENF